ncbi:hypothetical protein [Pseudomonas aegrilactucae]|uniref:Uncharacterized protein n=1 Tax=Pseudomonas aegrilactucae TaxID=2854028 RepID=A0A9Q3AG14_9PSED|nr:hypothetical protein [Pseudomonas aegrilactucae]MBV6288920.1 hypothetical protein [Pseudomonas aegrilactucae]
MIHELWLAPDDCQTFCLAGPRGDSARALLHADAKRVWQVQASSYFDAMTQYYAYMGWGVYRSAFAEQDRQPYTDTDVR